MSKYAKFLVALGALVVAVGHALVDGSVSPVEWGQIITAGTAAFGVWFVPNAKASA